MDAQPGGCGRDCEMLRRLSQESGVNIVASTGFHRMRFYPEDHWVFLWNADRLTRLFLSELCEGMAPSCDASEPLERTDIRAGQIKTALDAWPLSKQYEKLFDAAADAALASSAPLMIHIEAGSDPIALSGWLDKKGIPANKTIYCHMDRSVADLGVHRELFRRGVYLEYDTVARAKYHSDETETGLIAEMLDAGFERQIFMALDTTRERLRSYGNKDAPGLSYILTVFQDKLHKVGVTQEQTELFFIKNPARAFSIG